MKLKKRQRQKNPFLSPVDESTFYPYPPRTECFKSILETFQEPAGIVFIIGEFGSGKTLMMKELLAEEPEHWESCRINPRLMDEIAGPRPGKMMREFSAYIYRNDDFTAIMMDDAHDLETDELLSLLRFTGFAGGEKHADKILLFTEPALLGSLNELSDLITNENEDDCSENPETQTQEKPVKQIVIPGLSRIETETYVLMRLNSVITEDDEPLFNKDDHDWIFEESKAKPGGINDAASRLFTQRIKERSRFTRFIRNFF